MFPSPDGDALVKYLSSTCTLQLYIRFRPLAGMLWSNQVSSYWHYLP